MVKGNHKSEEHNIITYFGKTISFSEFRNKIEECVKSLSKAGVCKGEIVTIQALTMPQSVILFYALGYIGAVANFLYISASENEVIDNLNATKSKFYFVIDSIFSKFSKIEEKTSVEKIVLLGIGDEADFLTRMIVGFRKEKSVNTNNIITWNRFIKISGSLPTLCMEADLPVAMVYTSGTTGKSKAVVLSHKSINSLVVQYMKTGIDFIVNDKFMNAIPIFVAYGLVFGVHVPLCVGWTDILVVNPNPEKIGKTYLKYKPEFFVQGVAGVENIIQNAKKNNTNMSFVKVLGVGGDAVPNVFVDKVNSFLAEHNSDVKLVIGYGMTEVAATVVSSTPLVNKYGTVGIPLPDTNIKIVEESSKNELGYNQVGEICFNAPTMMCGYFNDEAETNLIIKKHEDGQLWVHSGDLGKIDEEGFVTVLGRIKRLIGVWHDGVYHKVAPQLVEKSILRCDKIENAVVVGRKVDRTKNELVAVVTLKNRDANDKEVTSEIEQIIKDSLEVWERPCGYMIVNSIPRNTVGKIDYREVEKMVVDSD